MGMPGSSEYLGELNSRVLGDFIQEGFVVHIADDLHVCGNSVEELINNWRKVLHRLQENNLKLSASKTVVCPEKTTVLGWIWSNGTLSPSSHKISPLVSTDLLKTCSSMRSYIGAYKALARCIPKYACLLSPLEDSIKGLQDSQEIVWTPELIQYFKRSQEVLKSPHTITIPTPSDNLTITVDASPVNQGLGATMYVIRMTKKLTGGFYSFKLKQHQQSWFPCELEALAISAAVKHFSPYIRESLYPTQMLSDNKPCVQAYNNLCKGHFSASPRVSTFLSTLSSYHVILFHLSGKDNLSSDYSSRNPQECTDTASSVVCSITVSDVISGSVRMPFLELSCLAVSTA